MGKRHRSKLLQVENPGRRPADSLVRIGVAVLRLFVANPQKSSPVEATLRSILPQVLVSRCDRAPLQRHSDLCVVVQLSAFVDQFQTDNRKSHVPSQNLARACLQPCLCTFSRTAFRTRHPLNNPVGRASMGLCSERVSGPSQGCRPPQPRGLTCSSLVALWRAAVSFDDTVCRVARVDRGVTAPWVC